MRNCKEYSLDCIIDWEYSNLYYVNNFVINTECKVTASTVDMSVVTLGLDTVPGQADWYQIALGHTGNTLGHHQEYESVLSRTNDSA